MATVTIPSELIRPDTAVVSLSPAQKALWELRLPVLDASRVLQYKMQARRVMLWQTIRWLLAGLAVLVGFECLGRHWVLAGIVGSAAVTLAGLFAWLVYSADLRWETLDYKSYAASHAVPWHVSDAAGTLLQAGVAEEQICVEYLKHDPILFVQDTDRRYDLILW